MTVERGHLQNIWSLLAQGAAGQQPALRQLVLCTCRPGAADGRMVILRHVDPARAQLLFYSDARADKMTQLEGGVAAVFWDPDQALQIRVQGTARAVTSAAEIDAHWQRIGEHGRRNYRAQRVPGSPVAEPEMCAQLLPASGREHFAVIALSALQLDVLWLKQGQRLRAQRAGGAWTTRWVQV